MVEIILGEVFGALHFSYETRGNTQYMSKGYLCNTHLFSLCSDGGYHILLNGSHFFVSHTLQVTIFGIILSPAYR